MIRTRFAPSPTGYMHIGNLRTALYAYLAARRSGGQFLLRIEDTDQKRNVPRAIQVIYDSLSLAGLSYDEGPLKPGAVGPYVQSQRKEAGIYKQYAELLVQRGGAFRCFCQSTGKEGRLAGSRRNPCRYLSPDEIQRKLDEGQPYVIRQLIPAEGQTTFHDLVYGDITVKHSQLDDQVLLKSDDFPTYNFANVVDDHLMGITHVIRGVEYLSSTPKYNLLYQSFGWQIPAYVHLPHIVKEGGKKLSKRAGDASFQDLLAAGYLPEAIVNYIALLGWSSGDNREIFSLADLEQAFDISHINKSKAAFSIHKLEWLNGEHIRALTPPEFHARALPFYTAALAKKCDLAAISFMVQKRVTRLSDLPHMTDFFLKPAAHDPALYVHEKSKSTAESSRSVLQNVGEIFSELELWNEETIRQALTDYGAQAGLKTGTVMWPVRVALTGLSFTPGGAIEIAAILGKKETLKRLKKALELFQS